MHRSERATPGEGLLWAALAGCAALTAVLFVLHPPGWFISWPFVVKGVHALVSPHALDLYGRHPELQMGPLTFLLSAPVVLLVPAAARRVVAIVLMLGCGLLVIRELGRLVDPGDRVARRRWFLTGLLALAAWSELAVRYAHADDVLALLGVVLGLGLLRRAHPVAAGLLLGLAVDAKPWVLPFVALLAMAEPGTRLKAFAAAVAVIAVAWLPFALLGAGSIRALQFRIPIEGASTLRLLGIRHGTPPWCRPAQMLLGAGAVLLLIRRSRWQAALLVVVAIRMLLDPAVKPYYDAGLVLGAAAFDLVAAVPVATLIATLAVAVPSLVLAGDPAVRGPLRAVALVALVLLGMLVPQRGARIRSVGRPREAPSPAPSAVTEQG
ncbi:MAG: glycosyltransferase 87 family protein [Amnibacterium sp.]